MWRVDAQAATGYTTVWCANEAEAHQLETTLKAERMHGIGVVAWYDTQGASA